MEFELHCGILAEEETRRRTGGKQFDRSLHIRLPVFGLRIEGGKFTRFMCSHVSLPEDHGEQEELIKLLREILAYCNTRNCEFGQVCLKVQGKRGQTGGLRGVGYMKGLSFLPLAILLGLVKGKAGKAAAVDSFPMNEEKGGNSKYMEYLKKVGATTDRQIQQVYEAIAATVIHTEIVHAENALCESTRTGPDFLRTHDVIRYRPS